MYELAKVLKVENTTAEVETGERAECGGCNACVFGKKGKHLLKAENSIGASVGDDVLIDVNITAKKTIFSAVVTMLIPLICLFLGVLIGYLLHLDDLISFLLSIIGLALGFSAAYAIDQLANKKGKFLAKIISINPREADSENSSDSKSDTEK